MAAARRDDQTSHSAFSLRSFATHCFAFKRCGGEATSSGSHQAPHFVTRCSLVREFDGSFYFKSPSPNDFMSAFMIISELEGLFNPESTSFDDKVHTYIYANFQQ